jgi:hypothetical protein
LPRTRLMQMESGIFGACLGTDHRWPNRF